MKQLGSFQSSVLEFDAQVLLNMQSILVFHCWYKYKPLS